MKEFGFYSPGAIEEAMRSVPRPRDAILVILSTDCGPNPFYDLWIERRRRWPDVS